MNLAELHKLTIAYLANVNEHNLIHAYRFNPANVPRDIRLNIFRKKSPVSKRSAGGEINFGSPEVKKV